MRKGMGTYLFGVFELLLTLGAVWVGILMISYPNGSEKFMKFPPEWIGKQPFNNWFLPGILSILFFGLFNIIAAVYSFMKKKKKAGSLGIIMGGILVTAVIVQIRLLGVYLASVELFILGSLQLCCGVLILKAWKIENQ